MKILTFILALTLISCAPLRPLSPQQISQKSSSAKTSATSQNYQSSGGITGISAWDKVLSPWLGVPYLSGGSTKNGTDCSGFTSSVYMEKEKMYIPRTTGEQSKMGKSVDKKSLAIGDIIYFGENGNVNHVGIYVGKDNFIHASTSRGVMVSPLEDVYWKPRYMGARRYL